MLSLSLPTHVYLCLTPEQLDFWLPDAWKKRRDATPSTS